MTQTITMTSLPNDGQPARNLSETQRQAVRDVVELARQRAIAEVEIESAYRQEMDTILQTFEKRQQELQQTFDSRRVAIQQEYQQVRKEAIARFDAEYGALEAEYKQTRDDFVLQYEAEREALDHAAQEGSWEATTLFDADRIRIEERHKETIKVTTEALEQIDVLQKQAKVLLQDWVDENRVPVKRRRKTEEAHLERLQQTVQDAAAHLEQLEGLTIPRLLKGEKIVWLFVLFWLVACAVFAFVMKLLLVLDAVEVNAAGWPKHWYIWFGIMTVTIGFACTITRFWLAAVGRQQIDAIYPSFCGALAEARALCKRCQEEDADSYQRLKKEYSDRHQKELARIKQQHQQKRAALERRYQQDVHDTDRDYRQRLADMKEAHDANLARIDEHYRRLMADALREFKAASQQAETDKQTATAKSQNRYEQAWKELIQRWTEGQKKLQGVARKVNTLGHKLFPSWSEVDWDQWHPPVDLPPGIRFGQFTFDLSKISHGVSADPRLPLLEPYRFDLPALLPFPHQSSLLLRAEGAGRDKAVQTLRAVMLRFLTTLPPGKVRFTIIDPVGLGENFAAFMHLADYNDALVTNRIWTEPTHIEQRLADLTEHMETVIQKYLRNQFRTIADYNRIAGEVAEPYRVLVVANFPANFTELAARRLLSIAASGSSCGVFTLISTDGKLPLPQDFDIRDIEQNSVTLIWNGEQFNWKDNDFGQCPLELEQPPGDHTCLQIMHTVGAKAKEASRVEVPFEVIAPPDDRWWSSDSRGGIKVPLGKAGATKLQNLELGQGTSQHVLVAGKTGSGKSTLLHALITNLALHYSPDEVEVYLIDFKKGVEFKTYAVHQLPHARVVAIESEREFGLSVLQRLDAELKARGELFRSMRVQDIHAYRNANPDAVMPRILLIVDEFQEFFVEDDKIAQDVALLLDRLVRQGRAFGIHVLLGSQTLSGAYSLARSTIGQMAVRIALQCSEADAGVILSEDNTAARLLSRPGEAIYNDANGMMEGNDFFQVVWLDDGQRERYLQRIRELAAQKQIQRRTMIVFEGNVPADVRNNDLLHETLTSAPRNGRRSRSDRAWLGEAIAIKEPTAADFRPQTGSNLLLVGQQDEAALSITAISMLSIAAQHSRSDPLRFYVLDGTPTDHPHAGYLRRVLEKMPAEFLPPLLAERYIGGVRELPEIIGEIKAEVERRHQEHDADAGPIYLVIYNLQRFRDLRKAEDDFGFGMDDKPANPAQQFSEILRDGSTVGIHTIAWCDSLNNVQRTLDRQSLREFEMRVLFQMSAADSSILIDTPAASKLGLYRALFYHEETGQIEKFRPYSLPSESWLAEAARALSQK